jgi:uncharacterized protein (DUF58 family)
VTLGTSAAIPLLEILLVLPANVILARGNNRLVIRLKRGEEFKHTFLLRALARGRCPLGHLKLRISDRSGLAIREIERDLDTVLHIYPAPIGVRQLPSPRQARSAFGNYGSPRLGDGLEPGDIRPFTPGDRPRRVNWPVSLRLRRLHVTQHHQERNADVVLLLDTYAEAGGPAGTTLDVGVRAAAALAAAYMSRKDRVGVVELGGLLRWIRPMSGRRHLEGLIEALLPADVGFTYVVRHLDVVPPRALPPRALVIAISPLLDERFTKALYDLEARRFDLLVLAISPVEPTRRALPPSPLTDLACRVWAAERRVLLDDLRRAGLPVLEWDTRRPLEVVLAAMGRHRAAKELAR